MIKHYARYWYPGFVVSSDTSRSVDSRDPEKVDAPSAAYAFQFFDREEKEVEGEILSGKKKNFSGMFYLEGEVYDIDRVKREVSDNRILLSNMESNGWERVISCPQGFLPFHKDDVVILDIKERKNP